MSAMEMDRTCVEKPEEAWIAKYRSSVKIPSIQPSRLTKVHKAVNSAYNIVMLRVHKALSGWTQARLQTSAPLPQPMRVPEPQPLTRKVGQATMSQATMSQATMNQATINPATTKQAATKQAESSGASRPRKRRQPAATARSRTA
jgi:hypothetical protein